MKNIILVFVLAMAGLSAYAQATNGSEPAKQEKSKNAKYDIQVRGNCEQCKKRIEKAAYSVSGVKSATYSLDDHMLHLIINEEKTAVTDVKKAVAKVGHDTDDIKATDEDYENLHHCCKYERK